MLGMPGPLGTIVDLLAVMLGFGAIVFIHELGHFIAARWAGIRVLTFSVGFGPTLVSYRRGFGICRGSTVEQYNEVKRRGAAAEFGEKGFLLTKVVAAHVGHTEYRISALPFGGYVQMLGQDDLDPTAVSQAPDSYQNAPVWKRMVVISAGVVMNIILAAVLFVVVFTAGLQVAPPVAGEIAPDGPAASAVYRSSRGDEPTVTPNGLLPGDRIVSLDGLKPNRFESLILKAAMAKQGRSLPITVERDTPEGPRTLRFEATPEKSKATGLLDLGIAQPQSAAVIDVRSEADRATIAEEFVRVGAAGLGTGDTITAVNGDPTDTYRTVREAFEQSGGDPVTLTVTHPDGSTDDIAVQPAVELQTAKAKVDADEWTAYEHLLGLTPVLTVSQFGEPAQGLEPGDIFKRIGSIEFPSIPAGIAEIRAHAGKEIQLVVLREAAGSDGAEPDLAEIPITAKVKPNGTVGFTPGSTADQPHPFLARPPALLTPIEGDPSEPAAASWLTTAGTQIRSINGNPVDSFTAIRTAITDAITADSPTTPDPITLTINGSTRWTIAPEDAAAVASLGWKSPIPANLFAPTQTTLQAKSPIHAIRLGIDETKRVMATVYVTFLRLTQGSIAIENIKGPVGIAHIGTMVADRGPIWMLFFLGMISVNLAVVNFLPLPIVDGGQFLMLLYEGIRGKPVPVAVQSVVMTAGLLIIASVFILVTFNDIKAILGV